MHVEAVPSHVSQELEHELQVLVDVTNLPSTQAVHVVEEVSHSKHSELQLRQVLSETYNPDSHEVQVSTLSWHVMHGSLQSTHSERDSEVVVVPSGQAAGTWHEFSELISSPVLQAIQ